MQIEHFSYFLTFFNERAIAALLLTKYGEEISKTETI